MKKNLLLLFFCFLTAAASNSQWQVQNYYPGYMNSCFIPATNTGWVCGSRAVRKTTDGGISWVNQYCNTSNSLNDIYFTDLLHGWVVGSTGEIFVTTNGGTNWFAQVSGISSSLHSVYFFNNTNGVASGSSGKILTTSNGGANWSVNTFNSGSIINLSMRSTSLAYASQNNNFIKSTNGGVSWSVAATIPYFILKLFFVSDNTGYLGNNYGTIFKTTNSGLNWVEQTTGNTNDIYSICFLNATTGCFSANNNNIYGTTNAGANWSLLYTAPAAITKIAFNGSSNLTGTGLSGTVISSTNNGSNWQIINQGTQGPVNDINFINPLTGWAANNDDRLLYTSNGGQNWVNSALINLLNADGVYFINGSTGFATGVSGSDHLGASTVTVSKTTNGGAVWNITTLPESGSTYKLQFVNANDGFILLRTNTLNYKIYKTSNAGTNWFQAYTTTEVMNDIYFTTQLNGWMAGESGKVYKTTNGGANWSLQASGTPNQLNAVFFLNANSGWACGVNGTVIATTNGGTNWSLQNTGTTKVLTDIEFGNASNGCAVGEEGVRLATGNGGTTWGLSIEPSQTHLISVIFPGTNQVYITGDNGYIAVNSLLVGILQTGNQTPGKFELNQNYPNPFNPTTQINISLPENEFVELYVYDITGKIVKTLVKDNLSSGSYSINFNAGGLSSGVYFYRLKAGEFTQVKKMILIK